MPDRVGRKKGWQVLTIKPVGQAYEAMTVDEFRQWIRAALLPTFLGCIDLAVFNVQTSDVRRARDVIRRELGEEAMKRLSKATNGGIMALFHVTPTPETLRYAVELALSVQRRIQENTKR